MTAISNYMAMAMSWWLERQGYEVRPIRCRLTVRDLLTPGASATKSDMIRYKTLQSNIDSTLRASLQKAEEKAARR